MAEDKPKHAGGRPTKYNDDVLQAAKDYLHSDHTHLPSVTRLADQLDVVAKTIYNWAEVPENIEFLQTLERINNKQELYLLDGGLNSSLNPTICKLALHNHGYHDKQDTHVKEFNVNIGNKDADTL